MSKEYLGIYIGESFVVCVRLEDKNLVAFTKLNISSLEEDVKEGVVKRDVLWEALINKVVREVGGGKNNEAFVSLEDKEFIYRCFDMPLMSKREVEASIKYEIEKYIPFSIEDLVWDYDYVKIPKDKKINLSFIGIKKITLERYLFLLKGANIRILNIEPSAVALMRVVRSLKIAKKINNFIILDFSPDASYITFFYNDLPIFNRFLGSYGKEKENAVDKIIDEVRISIQYFRREFRNYSLDKLFIIGDLDTQDILSSIKKEIDVDSLLVTTEDILNIKEANVGHLKAYAVATSFFLPARFKPTFYGEQKLSVEKIVTTELLAFNYVLLGAVILIGILGCFFFYALLDNNLSVKRYRIRKEVKKIVLPPRVKDKSIEEIKRYIKGKKSQMENLRNIFGKVKEITPFLDIMPDIIPQGLWLEDFSLRKDKGRLSLSITGYVFLASKEEETKSLDNFIYSLRNNETIKSYFSQLEIISIKRKKVEGYDSLSFSVKLK